MDEKRFIKLLWLIKASLVAILLYAGFEAVTSRLHFGRILKPESVSGKSRPAERPETAPQTDRRTDYTTIVRRNLFADGPVAPSSRSPALDTMPSAEKLGLKLIGAVAGGPVASRAIIENTKDKTTSPYRIGDVVASATIESIQPDAVILRCQGERFALRLQAAAGGDGNRVARREEPTKTESTPSNSREPSLSTRAVYVEDVFRKIQIEPYVKNKQTQGLRVTGLDKVPLAGMLGLQDGDVIQTINGQELTSKQKAFQVLMKAKTQSRMDIQLLRNGKSKDLSFNI